ncbi:MAG: redox-sensing transcriptional repressor Rex [Clostridiales bacterium]|nr:redox-sensing transcriptional repressor Rex [Clostridiales bacterium]
MSEIIDRNNNPGRVSDAMTRRMPAYYRRLLELENLGFLVISSKELARRMGLTDSQIRHDFNAFGGFGRRGRGYNVELLRKAIGDILDINREHNLIIIGIGNMGKALAQYKGFSEHSFKLMALFDANSELVGKRFGGARVYAINGLAKYLQKNPTDIAVICTPAAGAQELVEPLAAGGVKGIWNFAAVDLQAPDSILVNNVHLTDSLMMLAFRMHEKQVLEEDKSWISE